MAQQPAGGGEGGSFVHPSMAERIMDGDRLSVLTPVSLPLLMELLMSSEGPGLMTSPNPAFFFFRDSVFNSVNTGLQE